MGTTSEKTGTQETPATFLENVTKARGAIGEFLSEWIERAEGSERVKRLVEDVVRLDDAYALQLAKIGKVPKEEQSAEEARCDALACALEFASLRLVAIVAEEIVRYEDLDLNEECDDDYGADSQIAQADEEYDERAPKGRRGE